MPLFQSHQVIEKVIKNAASKRNIHNPEISVTGTKDGGLTATIEFKGERQQILFTPEEVKAAGAGSLQSKTMEKIEDALSIYQSKSQHRDMPGGGGPVE